MLTSNTRRPDSASCTALAHAMEVLPTPPLPVKKRCLVGERKGFIWWERAPADARPRTGYALALLALQPAERDQARALLAQVVEDSPWYTAAYVALADMAESDGDLKSAEVWLTKGLARNPNDARLLLPLGRLYSRHGRSEEARVTLVRALEFETHADGLREIALELSQLRAP